MPDAVETNTCINVVNKDNGKDGMGLNIFLAGSIFKQFVRLINIPYKEKKVLS